MQQIITAEELETIKKQLWGQQEITAAEMGKVRKRFRPGMRVRNTISDGTGTLRARSNRPDQLDISCAWVLQVDRIHLAGRRVGQKHETCWSILNIEII